MPLTGKSVSLLSSTNTRLFFAEMLRMQFMDGMVMIMANVAFVWNSPGLTEVGVGGPAVGGMGLLQDLISEFLFQVCSFQTEWNDACKILSTVWPPRNVSFILQCMGYVGLYFPYPMHTDSLKPCPVLTVRQISCKWNGTGSAALVEHKLAPYNFLVF